MTEQLQRQVLGLIATDRISIPVKSISGKIDRTRPKLGKAINLSGLNDEFVGERCYARVDSFNREKARNIREAVNEFSEEHPKYGNILNEKIAQKRISRETHLYFGMNDGCRLTADDYTTVLTEMGFTEVTAKKLYPELIEVSRKISKKREADNGYIERSVIVG